jgi:glycosyltransferase involved in cell wall biosynthesis
MEKVKLTAENLGFIARMNNSVQNAMEDPKFIKMLDEHNQIYLDFDFTVDLVRAWNHGYDFANSEYRRYGKHAKSWENAR